MSTLMTTGDALLRCVLAEPFCNVPRLVYADWLEENEQWQRAEYIRACINFDRLEFDEWFLNRADAVLGHTPKGYPYPNLEKWFPTKGRFEYTRIDGGFANVVRFHHINDFIENYKRVFSSQPITKVVCEHKSPAQLTFLYFFKWIASQPPSIEYYYLSPDIFEEMEVTWFKRRTGLLVEAAFSTLEEALEALSRTLVNYARVRVGLERLKFPAYA